MGETIRVGRRTISLSSTDKLLFPDDDVTKGDLVHYYAAIGDKMLAEVRDRLITMERFPGPKGERIMQKNKPKHFPDWIKSKTVPKKGGVVDHVVVTEKAALVYLANQGCITIHIGMSSLPHLAKPDQMIFDLDPSTDDFELVRKGALEMRSFLEDLGFVPFVKTSGSRGLHLTVPLRPTAPYEDVRSFAREAAAVFAATDPKNLTVEQRKEKRGKRVFLDWMRNTPAQTAVAPYSVRARPGGPVALPIYWDEVADKRFRPTKYLLKVALEAVDAGHDPWSGWRRRARSIAEPRRRLERQG